LTKEEIESRKEALRVTISVPSILSRYGVQVRGNRCRSFCHECKNFNMKVFETGCHCFVCDKSFDIFDIVQHFENCDFWSAFELLGGTEKLSFTTTIKANKAKRERDQRVADERKTKAETQRLLMLVTAYRNIIVEENRMSDVYAYCYNKLQFQLYLLEIQTEKR